MKLLYFSNEGCGPCGVIKPQVQELCQDADIDFEEVKADDEPFVASAYKVRSVPTMVLLDDGKEITRGVSFDGLNKMREALKK